MGITFLSIEKMHHIGLFDKKSVSILDIGSSNLYSAPAEGVKLLLNSLGINIFTEEITSFAQRMEKDSAYDEVTGGTNGAFVGELFEKIGYSYNSIDIADGYRTTILDLNHESAPKSFIGSFDLVMNFGTTEHLLNQFNAFKVIHDATKLGGYIVHSLPCVGYSNHGYFTYTTRCMFDLAGYNEYEVVAFWFEGPSGSNDLFDPIRDYCTYFPALGDTLLTHKVTEVGKKIAKLEIPDVGLFIVYRKVKEKPFAGALERSTSVGVVSTCVTQGYESLPRLNQQAKSMRLIGRSILDQIRLFFSNNILKSERDAVPLERHDELHLTGQLEESRDRFIIYKFKLEESLNFYSQVVSSHGYFPMDWEVHILLLALDRYPGRKDLVERLAFIEDHLLTKKLSST
jgi:hypothetical protein